MIIAYDPLEEAGGQTRHRYKVFFFPLCFKMAESFANFDKILRHGRKIRYKKALLMH